MHLWELCTEVRRDSWGGRAIHSTIVYDAVVVGGGDGGGAGGCRTMKTINYKR